MLLGKRYGDQGVKTKVDRIYDKIEQPQNFSFEIFNSLEERQLEVIA